MSRNRQRINSDDEDEEEASNQQQNGEEVNVEKPRAAPSSSRSKKLKKVTGNKANEDEEEENERQEPILSAEERKLTLDTFEDVMLENDEFVTRKLSTFLKDYSSQIEHLKGSIASYQNTAGALREIDCLESEMELEYDSSVRALVDEINLIEIRRKAFGELSDNIRHGRTTNPADHLKKVLGLLEKAYHTRTARQKYARSDAYTAYKTALWNANIDNDGPMPPLSGQIPREDGDVSDDEDDLEMGGMTQDFKCPITILTLKNPVKSKICGHAYSKAAIEEVIEQDMTIHPGQPKQVKCPQTGCRQMVSHADLYVDKAFEKSVEQYVRRQKRREARQRAEEDDAEMIDDDD